MMMMMMMIIIIQRMYSDPLEYSKLTLINRHQHENTKISTRNANFCSFILNTFFFDFNSINTEKKLFSVFCLKARMRSHTR